MEPSSRHSAQIGPKIIVAIPCFNTESTISDVVARARKYVDQVIVIDDGSSDATMEVARAAGALVVDHHVNKGYGEAIKFCIEAARTNGADIVVTLDGDGQHNPDEIPGLITPILRGEADVVIGSRFLNDGCSMPGYRRFGISVITMLFNFGSGTKVTDSQSGFRAYSRKMFETLKPVEKGMSISIETIEKVRVARGVIGEVPISCHYATSTLNPKAIRHGLGVALSVVKIRLKSLLFGLF